MQYTDRSILRDSTVTRKIHSRSGRRCSRADSAVGRHESHRPERTSKRHSACFRADNGPVLEEMSKPYRGTKNTTFEGGVRQPAIIRWPDHTEPGTTKDGLMFITDFFPTFLTLANGNASRENAVDGIDMTRMLFGKTASPRDEIIFDVTGSVRVPTIRKGDFKLMGNALYNIRMDPSETTDVAAQHPDLVEKLQIRRCSWSGTPAFGQQATADGSTASLCVWFAGTRRCSVAVDQNRRRHSCDTQPKMAPGENAPTWQKAPPASTQARDGQPQG